MPDNLVNRPAMRAGRHSIRCLASFIAPAPIATGTLTATPTFPGNNNVVNVSFVTGSHLLVDFGMEVAFFDAVTGALKGRTHIRYGVLAANALNLFISEFAKATLNLASGDVFKIYPEWRMHHKLVAATSAFPPDFRFMTTENEFPEPVVNSGGDTACMVDGYGTAAELTYATVQMTGDTSFTVHPAAGTVNHLWTLPTGVTFAPGSVSTDANPVLRADVGTHTLTHEGEDDASGSTRKSHPSIRVHNDADPPHSILLTAYEGTAEAGWNWEVEVLAGDVSLSAIPDRCKAILHGREKYGDTWVSYRNASPGRSHILGVGYVARDTSSGSSLDGVHHLTFEVISPIERMKQIKSYSKVMLEDANPDAWSEIYVLGVLRGILQITQYYLMLVEAGFDLIVDPDFLDERYPAHFLDATNFFDQIMELAKAVSARLICDRTGRFDLHTHPAHIPLADRAAVTVALEIEAADFLEYEWTREHATKVAQMKVSGISGGASQNQPVFALYPGGAAGEGIDAPEIAHLILDESDPQGDVNGRTGRYGALADMTFTDANRNKHVAFDLRLKLRGAYDVFDFYKEYVEVVIVGNKRGLDLSGLRFYLLSSSSGFDPQYGTMTTDLVLRMETNSADGETFIPPDDSTGNGDGQPPPFEPSYTTPTLPLSLGSGRLLALDHLGNLLYTPSANSAVPVWYALALSPTGTLLDFVPDPFCPLYLGSGDALWLRVLTTTRTALLVFDSATQTVTSYTNQASFAAADAGRIEMERATPGLVAATLLYPGGDNVLIVTLDGTSWGSPLVINTGAGAHAASGLHVSGKQAGRIHVSENKDGGVATVGKLSISGAALGALSSPNLASFGMAGALTVPWHNNPSDQHAFFGVDAIPRGLIRVNGSAQTDVAPTFNGSTGGAYGARGLDTSPLNRLQVAAVMRNGTDIAGDPADTLRVFYSINGGVNWNGVTALDSTAASPTYLFVRFLGDAPKFLTFGVGGRIALCDLNGNYRDLSGNLAALGAGNLLNVCGF